MLLFTSCSLQLILLAQFAAASPKFDEIFRATSQCPADKEESWGYRGDKAPMYWGESYPACYGTKQSPIDIDTDYVINDQSLTKLDLKNYNIPIATAKVENNGHSVKLTPLDNNVVQRTIDVAGSTYSFQQLHFHWGDSYSKGSEHTVDGMQYAMEMHLVHTNSNNNIAVVGIFFQEGEDNNAELQKIVNALSELKYKESETTVSGVILNNLLPENPASYYRYDGSLTTPGCAEGVIWSVLPGVLQAGKTQLDEFRKLSSTEKENDNEACTISNNYRPTQPLNNRIVYESQ